MTTHSSREQARLKALAAEHAFSDAAVQHLFAAIVAGGGRMASFQHPEFGGAGQWMQGGLLMIADASNHTLKARVDALCNALAELACERPDAWSTAALAWQSQAAGPGEIGDARMRTAQAGGWWPDALGCPTATGQQNDLEYAYFADAQRLAIRVRGNVAIYDTGPHRISGISQAQLNAYGTVRFISQFGAVDLQSLPRAPDPQQSSVPEAEASDRSRDPSVVPAMADCDMFTAIERLGELRRKGLLTEDEFNAKKTRTAQSTIAEPVARALLANPLRPATRERTVAGWRSSCLQAPAFLLRGRSRFASTSSVISAAASSISRTPLRPAVAVTRSKAQHNNAALVLA